MERNMQEKYMRLLREELVPALGCTEPIAIAYAAAVGRRVLGAIPEHVRACMSGNIVKNVKCVVVPNSGGCRGIETAVALGIAGGDDSKELEVLSGVTETQRQQMRRLLDAGVIEVALSDSDIPLDILLEMERGADHVRVRIAETHLNVVCLEKNGETIVNVPVTDNGARGQETLSAREILEFADTCPLEEVRSLLEEQIACNTAISDEGLNNPWGACIGQTILEGEGSVQARAAAAAAAGSDARMSGCELPVVINSGSGNQGITVCMPVVTYARELGVSHEVLLRALLVSNLLAICQKKRIGSLSAYCGAVSAGCAAAAGVAYLHGLCHQEILDTFSNGLDIASGVVCDGASASCAGKIAVGVYAGLLGMDMARRQRSIQPGDGIVGECVDDTIAHVGTIAREGMKTTDREILQIMLSKERKGASI